MSLLLIPLTPADLSAWRIRFRLMQTTKAFPLEPSATFELTDPYRPFEMGLLPLLAPLRQPPVNFQPQGHQDG